MESSLLSVSANGIDGYADYVDIIRAEVAELQANGIDYEEHDRREPITVLVIAVVTAALTTGASEIVKAIIERLSNKVEKQPQTSQPPIQVVINNAVFNLPRERASVIDELDKAVA